MYRATLAGPMILGIFTSPCWRITLITHCPLPYAIVRVRSPLRSPPSPKTYTMKQRANFKLIYMYCFCDAHGAKVFFFCVLLEHPNSMAQTKMNDQRCLAHDHLRPTQCIIVQHAPTYHWAGSKWARRPKEEWGRGRRKRRRIEYCQGDRVESS